MNQITKKHTFHIFIIFVIFLIYLKTSSSSDHKTRIKRRVLFSKSSKLFFRVNGKENMFNYTQIFAVVYAVRVNFDLPDTLPKRHQFFKRDIRTVIDYDGFVPQEFSCVAKYFCQVLATIKSSEHCGIYCGIGNIIAKSDGLEAEYFKSLIDKCNFHAVKCPY